MQIQQYSWHVLDSNSWLITENHDGLLIDAVDNSELIKAILPLGSLTIILTHCHFDHICGLNRIREIRPDAVLISTKRCSENIGNKFRNMSSSADVFLAFYQHGKMKDTHVDPFVCLPAEKIFEEEMELDWQGHQIRLDAVHGHSSDGLIVNIDGTQLFSGDTLLSVPTATRLPGGNTKKFREEDLPKLCDLNTCTVFPGHGDIGCIRDMITINQDNLTGR